jgi:hypothetical protein
LKLDDASKSAVFFPVSRSALTCTINKKITRDRGVDLLGPIVFGGLNSLVHVESDYPPSFFLFFVLFTCVL